MLRARIWPAVSVVALVGIWYWLFWRMLWRMIFCSAHVAAREHYEGESDDEKESSKKKN